MIDRTKNKQETLRLFQAILELKTEEECTNFFSDLCTIKELADMAQRLKAAEMLIEGKTYEQIVKTVKISTATISRINQCIQYGEGGYRTIIERMSQKTDVDLE